MRAQEEDRRDRLRTLRVVVNARERTAIQERAAAAGLSVSAYLRSAALGKRTGSSRLDRQAVREVTHVNADLARLGNLLKAALALEGGRPRPAEIGELIERIRVTQDQLAEIAGRV